jgi:CDP-glucose 4,6-dehydratase
VENVGLARAAIEPEFWAGRKVLVTGHTGFKGSWLCAWLKLLGAEVLGIALENSEEKSIFHMAQIHDGMESSYVDIRDRHLLFSVADQFRPSIVFHLAAQSLVRESYSVPHDTYDINVMGTLNVLDMIRNIPGVAAAVFVTTDKCYLNQDWEWGYRESDALGGHDPYSSSKACAEILVASYRSSFFSQSKTKISTVRAGNIIGGGDYANDRLIPDAARAFASNELLKVRNPHSVRPWQHVLEPLYGYLLLAEHMSKRPDDGFDAAWNLGPPVEDAAPVGTVIRIMAERWEGGPQWTIEPGDEALPESKKLLLDSSKIRQRLGWRSKFSLEEAIDLTVDWYRSVASGSCADLVTNAQIEHYQSLV